MKFGKRLPALALALCLLLSFPLSVLAVGTEASADFKLIGALPLTAYVDTPAPGCGIHTAQPWSNRGLILYYNETLAKNTYTESRKTLMVVDENDQCVEYLGKKLIWNLGNDTDFQGSGWQIRAYVTMIYNDHYKVTYNGADVSTWSGIINMLANAPELAGKGYRLQVRLYDKNNPAGTPNGFVEPQKSVTGKYLKATGADQIDANRSGDYALIELGTVAKGATRITRTGLMTLDRVEMLDQENMQLTFSQSATVDPARTDASLQVVGADGSVLSSFPVALTEGGARKVDARLSNHTWADVQEALGANANSTARLLLTEKNVAASRDERYNNFAVDTIWGTDTDMPLQGHLAHLPAIDSDKKLGTTPDYIYATVVAPQDETSLTLTRAQVQTVEGKDSLVLTFSQPVAWSADARFSLALIDSEGNPVSLGGAPAVRELDSAKLATYGPSGRSIILPLKEGSSFGGAATVAAIREAIGEPGENRLVVRISDKASAADQTNGRIDSLFCADDASSKLVYSLLAGGEEWSVVDLDETAIDSPSVKSVYIYKERSLIVTFDREMVITPNLYSAIRLVDENNTLYWANTTAGGATVYSATREGEATSPLQWQVGASRLENGATVSRYAEYGQSARQFVGAFNLDYSKILAVKEEAEAYFAAQGTPKTLSLKLCFEELNADEAYGKLGSGNGVVDSIYSADGELCLPAYRSTANAAYASLLEAQEITLAGAHALSASAVEVLFSAPVRTDVYSASKQAAFRLELYRADGTRYSLATGHEPVFDGVLSAVEASGSTEEGYTRWQLGDLYQAAYGNKRINLLDLLAALSADSGMFAGCSLRLTVTESPDVGDVVGWIDNITSADGHNLLKANNGRTKADTAVSGDGSKAVTVETVEAIAENKLRVTFSEEVRATAALTGLIRLTDSEGYLFGYENGAYVQKVKDGNNWIQWAGKLVPAEGESGREWIVSLNWLSAGANDLVGTWSVSRIYEKWETEWKAQGKFLRFTLEDSTLLGNGLIDTVESVATGRKLVATGFLGATADQAGWNDFSQTDLCSGPFFEAESPKVTFVRQYGKNQVLVGFSQPVAFYNREVREPFIGIRLVGDENLALAYINYGTNEVCYTPYATDAASNPLYWNTLTEQATTDELQRDANGEIQLDEHGNPVKNSRRINVAIQWLSTASELLNDGKELLVTFPENLDIAALVSEESLKDYMKTGNSIMLCIEETDTRDGTFTSRDHLIHNLVSATGRQLKANKPGGGNNAVVLPIEPLDAGAPVTVEEVRITGESELTFRFSEAVDLTPERITASLRFVEKRTGYRLNTVEDGALQWNGIVSYLNDSKTELKWTLNASNPANRRLALGSLWEIYDLVTTKDSIKNLDGELVLSLQETENSLPGFVETFRAASGKIIAADPYIPGGYDALYSPVDLSSAIRGSLSLVSAEVLSDNKIRITFSDPVTITGKPWISLRLFNARNSLIFREGKAMQWPFGIKSISQDGTQILMDLYGNRTTGLYNLAEILETDWTEEFGEGAHLRFYIEELGDSVTFYNGHVDNIALQSDPRIHLDATDVNQLDGAGVALTQDYTYNPIRTTVTAINETQLRIRFSQSVEVEGEVYMGICYVDENYNLLHHLYTSGRGALQWEGSWKWEDESHTSMIWTKTANLLDCKTIGDIVSKKGKLAELYPNAQVLLRIEEKTNKTFAANSWTKLVDNVVTRDGRAHLQATKAGESDRFFAPIGNVGAMSGEEVKLLSVKALDNSTLELTFSEAVSIKEGDQAPTMAIRYLTAAGNPEFGTDGRAISFTGSWSYKDENKNVILWRLDKDKAAKRGASSLDDIFTFANDLQWNKGARVAFVILDSSDHAFSGSSMRINGVTDLSGTRNLVANHGGDISEVQLNIEIGYELPAEEVVETVTTTNYLPYLLIGVGLLVICGGAAVLIASRRRKKH